MADVHIRELRRAVQQMFMGYASLNPDRKAARKLVYKKIAELNLTVRGEKGEEVEDVEGLITDALDEIQDFSLEVPHE